MDYTEQLRAIRTQLRRSMNGMTAKSMRDKGVHYRMNFGVELPRIKQIIASIPEDHDFAQLLWSQEVRECKIMAMMLQPKASFTPAIAEAWVESIRTYEIAEYLCMYLLQYLDYASKRAVHWLVCDDPLIKFTGLTLFARLVTREEVLDELVAQFFLESATEALSSENFHLKQAAMLALRKFAQRDETSRAHLRNKAAYLYQSPSSAEVKALIDLIIEEESEGWA